MICTLNSVFFLDDRNGWAAGGMAYPYLHDSSGVVLSTRDGGLNWQVEPAILPAVRKIRFWTDRQGWAVGCPSPCSPAGFLSPAMAAKAGRACHGGAFARAKSAKIRHGCIVCITRNKIEAKKRGHAISHLAEFI